MFAGIANSQAGCKARLAHGEAGEGSDSERRKAKRSQ